MIFGTTRRNHDPKRWVNDDNGYNTDDGALYTVRPAWGGLVLPMRILPAKPREVLVSAEVADCIRCSTSVPGWLAPHESSPRVSPARLGIVGADRRTWIDGHLRQDSGERQECGESCNSENSDRDPDWRSNSTRHLSHYLPPQSLVRMKESLRDRPSIETRAEFETWS